MNALTEEICRRRLVGTEGNKQQAAQETKSAVKNALIKYLKESATGRKPTSQQFQITLGRAQETFDRAHGKTKLKRAGVDLNEYPEFRTLQTFFELGLPPPTHAEAADYIISQFGTRKANAPGDDPNRSTEVPMPLSNLLKSAAGTCPFCNQKAGIISHEHPECRRTHQAGWNEMVKPAARMPESNI